LILQQFVSFPQVVTVQSPQTARNCHMPVPSQAGACVVVLRDKYQQYPRRVNCLRHCTTSPETIALLDVTLDNYLCPIRVDIFVELGHMRA